ncbi:MAG: HNH endonuclease, partial [Bifidobacteriaceae bacterium]|nr:HNH endonuclease [Bifidobacteriaceae bacterium]
QAVAPRANRPGTRLSAIPLDFDPANRATWPIERVRNPGYVPSEFVAVNVRLRDQHCVWPGCDVPAEACQIDHVVPFDPGLPAETQTVARGLQCLCPRHHLAKHKDGWQVQRDTFTGATTWTSPTGQTHTVPPAVYNQTA